MPPLRKTRCIDKRVRYSTWIKSRDYLQPALNLSKYFETTIEAGRGGRFPYFFHYPVPVMNECVPLTQRWKDIGTDIVRRSLKYHKELKLLKETMMCNKKLGRVWAQRLKQRKEVTNGEGPFNIYPSELIQYAKLLELNPEPEFNGGYNWYLTGGSLSVVNQNDKNFVVKPFGTELNHLDIIPFNKKGTRLSTSKTVRLDLSTGGPIHEISVQPFDDELLIATRNKHNIGILKYQSNSEPIVSNYESKIPYASCDLSSEPHLATTNTDKQMRVFDLETSKTRNKFDLEYIASLHPDNWSCIRNFQPNIYLYGDRRNLRPIDTRTKVIGTHFDVSEYGEICDFMSCFGVSRCFEYLLYVGTAHRLFAIDLRNFSGVIDDRNMALSWNHMMNLPPLMLKTVKKDESELILISSNLHGDMRVMLTDYGSEYKNLYLPIRPPSVLDSLQIAKDNFVCLDPISTVNQRARLCVTGYDFICTPKGKTSIVSQNSICDLFVQNVEKERQDDLSNVCYAMKSWMETVNETEKSLPETKEFGATAVIYKKDMLRALKSTRLIRPTPLEEEVEAARPKQRPKWQKSVTELAKYKDALVESIMEVWDFPLEDEENLTLPEAKPEPLEMKIHTWLEKSEYTFNNEENIEDVTIEPKTQRENSPPISTKDTSYTQFAGEFNLIQTSTQQDQEVTQEPMAGFKSLPRTRVPVKSTAKTKKKRHVIGF